MNNGSGDAGAPGKRSSQLLSIQVLRAVAALGVLIHHSYFEVFYRFLDGVGSERLIVGAAGVDLFFVISGFVMVYASEALFGRRDAPRLFFLRRLARIVPLYWAVSAIILGYVLVTYGHLLAGIYSAGSVIASFAFIPYPGPDGGLMQPVHGLGWTLNYEMFFYVVFAAAVLLRRRGAVAAVVAAFVVLVTIGRTFPLRQPFAFWCDPIILEFCFGMLIALAYREGLRLPYALSFALVLAALAAYATSAVTAGYLPSRALEWGLPGAALVAALALSRAAAPPGRIALTFAFLGDASYSIYLVHPLVIPPLRRILSHIVDLTIYPWVYGLAIFFVAIAAAIASYLLFEKPITRVLQRHLRGAAKAAAAPARYGSL